MDNFENPVGGCKPRLRFEILSIFYFLILQ